MKVGDSLKILTYTKLVGQCPECGNLLNFDVTDGKLNCDNFGRCSLSDTFYLFPIKKETLTLKVTEVT